MTVNWAAEKVTERFTSEDNIDNIDQRLPFSASVRNHLLTTLPSADLALIWPKLKPVSLTPAQSLNVPGEAVTAIYFIESGVVSIATRFENGDLSEFAMIGKEGMVGLSAALDFRGRSYERTVHGRGTALRMDVAEFRNEMVKKDTLCGLLLNYVLIFVSQVAQIAACNGRHTLDKRLAKWLLMFDDRMNGEDLQLSQEVISMMLCARRGGVTIAAGNLQSCGLIKYSRGRITILDRPGLEAMACECYKANPQEYARLITNADGQRTRPV